MNNQDPIADMLTRIRNANRVGRRMVLIPKSKICNGIAQVLKDEGYIEEFDVDRRRRAGPDSRQAEVFDERREGHPRRSTASPSRAGESIARSTICPRFSTAWASPSSAPARCDERPQGPRAECRRRIVVHGELIVKLIEDCALHVADRDIEMQQKSTMNHEPYRKKTRPIGSRQGDRAGSSGQGRRPQGQARIERSSADHGDARRGQERIGRHPPRR